MKQNLFLVLGVIAAIVIAVNSTKRILFFKANARQVADAEMRLNTVKVENERLKRELEYKKSDQFAEEEIRNKLGLVRENEQIVLIQPKTQDAGRQNTPNVPNWQKWRMVFFGS